MDRAGDQNARHFAHPGGDRPIALVEPDISVAIVTGAFLIAFGALALSFVLAFGLGSKRAVETMWEEYFCRRKEEREKAAEKKKGK